MVPTDGLGCCGGFMVPTDGLGCCGWMVPTDGQDVVVDAWFPLMVGML